MKQGRARQLGLRWDDREVELPEAVRDKLRALIAQLLRTAVEAERGGEGSDDE